MQKKILKFKHGPFSLHYPPDYYVFLYEQYIFDIYRSHLLKDGDFVLDLGASIGAFTILASRKVGKKGMVIAVEPNKADYDLLIQNIETNHCKNVISVNIGVSDREETRDMPAGGLPGGRNFRFTTRPITEVLQDIHVEDKIGFFKMDIEGYEVPVIKSSTELFRTASVLSIECHSNKSVIDRILGPMGFKFYPVTTRYLAKVLLRNAISHPSNSIDALIDIVKHNPQIFYKILSRQEYFGNLSGPSNNIVGPHNDIGSYIKLNGLV